MLKNPASGIVVVLFNVPVAIVRQPLHGDLTL
jgi:hypothetical protein